MIRNQAALQTLGLADDLPDGSGLVQGTPVIKRLNVNLPAALFDELQLAASRSNRTMTDLVRIALGLVRIGIDETDKGNRIAVTSPDGALLKEILIPK